VKHDWTVLKAFSPYFAGLWFVRNGTDGWKQLGGILLAFTGVEALFADLGAFSRTYENKLFVEEHELIQV
jgi:KUP system potassium uptake protein